MSDIMEKYGNTKIKELIKQFPDIVNILEEYQIDCVLCKKKTCRLDDIVEAENLTMNQEIEMIDKISKLLS